jgi:hypothetical protein
MKTTVTWQDVGCPEAPGTYPFNDGLINIRRRELDVWKEHPDALFTVAVFKPITGPVSYGLGSYELPVEDE